MYYMAAFGNIVSVAVKWIDVKQIDFSAKY